MKIAKLLALVLAVLMMLVGITALALPERVFGFAQFTTTPNGVYVAAAIRLAIGLILLLGAGGSRFPTALRILGALVTVAGVATVLMGANGARAIATTLANYGTTAVRAFGIFVLAVGGFVVYAVSNRESSSARV